MLVLQSVFATVIFIHGFLRKLYTIELTIESIIVEKTEIHSRNFWKVSIYNKAHTKEIPQKINKNPHITRLNLIMIK